MGYVPSPERLRKGPHPLVHVEEECGYCGPPDVSDRTPMSDTKMSDKPQMSDNLSDICTGCSEAWTGRGPLCWGCQKRKQRNR